MKILVTGAAGFIGSNLVDRLLSKGHTVIGVDNFSTGREKFLATATGHRQFRFEKRDLLDAHALDDLGSGVDWIFHLAANADVRDGLLHPEKDLQQNTIVTWNVLESVRRNKIRGIAFSSTGSVYGEAKTIPTPENCPFPVQTSLYGASKLACEGLLAAYAEGYGIKTRIFRFVSILGPRYTHGHVFDFVQQLKRDPKKLRILGNGTQKKSYLSVDDCVSAMLTAVEHQPEKNIEIYNLGTEEYVDVNQSVDVITKEMGVNPTREYAGGDRGWVGDNPFIYLDTAKIRSIGWSPRKNIRDSVQETVRFLVNNAWVFEEKVSAR